MSHRKLLTRRWYGLIIAGLILKSVCASSVSAGEAQYAYDDLGRLTTVVDEAGNTAIYNYDAVGNLLGIDRFRPGMSGIGNYTLLPGKGAIGNQVNRPRRQ